MTADALVITGDKSPLLATTGNKDTDSRVRLYGEWLMATGRHWADPDLATYRDHLKNEGKADATVRAHLSSIRGAYKSLLRSNIFRDWLFTQWPTDIGEANRKAKVDEFIIRIQNAIHPDAAPVSVTENQDRPDSYHLRLTRHQASALIDKPGVDTLRGLRDTAIIALLLCTGIREGELAALDVPDLRQTLGGELALQVRTGKNNKSRLIPYGELDWLLVIVDAWLEKAGISDGAVIRGLSKSGKALHPRSDRLSVRGVQRVLARYPLSISERVVRIRPHDCRRTYARRLYEAGVDLVAIQQNLGHADLKTTLGYIGELDASKRRGRAVYDFDVSKLG